MRILPSMSCDTASRRRCESPCDSTIKLMPCNTLKMRCIGSSRCFVVRNRTDSGPTASYVGDIPESLVIGSTVWTIHLSAKFLTSGHLTIRGMYVVEDRWSEWLTPYISHIRRA